jgi:hypothetical protein
MSPRTISRSAIVGCVKLLRLPWDATVTMRTRNGGKNLSQTTIALDRLEARVLGIAGRTLRDDELVVDAERRKEAADERERAGRLRAEAEARSEHAEERLSEQQRLANQQRRQAVRRAADRKKRADQRSKAEGRRIAGLQSRRRIANEKVTARKAKAIDDRSKRSRLQQLDHEADALAKKQDALTAKSESQRLRQAASKAKSARKREAEAMVGTGRAPKRAPKRAPN